MENLGENTASSYSVLVLKAFIDKQIYGKK